MNTSTEESSLSSAQNNHNNQQENNSCSINNDDFRSSISLAKELSNLSKYNSYINQNAINFSIIPINRRKSQK